MRRQEVAGRVIAITGGARGIGRATAQQLAARGARVAIGDIDAETARATATELGVEWAWLDVTDRASVAAFLDEVTRRLGAVDVLVANAGVMALWPLVDEPAEVTEHQLDVNVRGALHCLQEALPRFEAGAGGQVVIMSSVLGKAGLPGAAVYSATKHAVIGLAHAARRETSRRVRISVVAPSLVATELAAGVRRRGLVPILDPDDVAATIVGVVERPRAEVVRPRWLAALLRARVVLPTWVVEAFIVALGGSRLLRDHDRHERGRYHHRAFRR